MRNSVLTDGHNMKKEEVFFTILVIIVPLFVIYSIIQSYEAKPYTAPQYLDVHPSKNQSTDRLSPPKYLDVHLSKNQSTDGPSLSFLDKSKEASSTSLVIDDQAELFRQNNYYANSSIIHGVPKQYTPPPAAELYTTGKILDVSNDLLQQLRMPETNFSVLTDKTVNDFIFVIGTSSNHFRESTDSISTVQKYMRGFKILYYDLGLAEDQIKKLKTYCDVIYKKFDYDKYPPHVRKLTNYAFKPLVIQEVLTEYRATVWMDSSFRLQKTLALAYPQILETGGVLQFWRSPHTNFAVTNKKMYEFIPTNVEKQKTVWSRAAGSVYWHRTEKVYWGVFYWWVLCALDPNCISPPNSKLMCGFKGNYATRYANCHRFDMSALNVLMANLFGYKDSVYTCRDRDIVLIKKRVTNLQDVKYC